MIICLIICAVLSYVIGGVNSAIILSKLIYGEDIRDKGSGNPGFTNFKRVYGNRPVSWLVMSFDILKTILPVLITAAVLESLYGSWQLGAAASGLFCTIGHCFPVWYKFYGGKGFLTSLSTIWIIDWRCGLIATCVMVILLLTSKYMSLSTMAALISGTAALAVLHLSLHPVPVVLYFICVSIMIFRHKENIARLLNGTESKFTFKKGNTE